MPRCFTLAMLLLLGLTACQGQIPQRVAGISAPGWDIGPLPVSARRASTAYVIDGADTDAVGGTTTVDFTSLIIDGTPPPMPPAPGFSWARYGFLAPAGTRINSISLDVQDVQSEYWIGLSNYTRGVWEWHGPFSVNQTLPIGIGSANYVSPAGTFYWAVVAAHGNVLKLNFTTVDYTNFQLYVPPQGQQTAVAGGSLAPALALNSSDHAPLIAYIHVEGVDQKLYLAYYDSSVWVQQPLLPEHNFSRPQLRWLGTEWIVTAYDQTAGALVDIRINQTLSIVSITTIMADPGLAFANQSLDVSPAGELGLAHGYTDGTTGQLYYSWNDGSGWQSTPALHDGDPVGGMCFRFDPQPGADPWLFYTHGTIDTTSTILINYTMEEGRLNGGTWTFTPFDYPDSPLAMDLRFKTDQSPQLCFLASKLFTYENVFPPFTFSGSLLYNIVVSSKSGAVWNAPVTVFAGSLVPHFTLAPPLLTVDVDDAAEVEWAKDSELLYASFTGTVDIDLGTLQPNGGSLAPNVQYMEDEGSGFTASPFFSGLPGNSFSWDEYAAFSYQAAAYIKSDNIDPAALMGGQVDAANDLLFWSYAPPPPPP